MSDKNTPYRVHITTADEKDVPWVYSKIAVSKATVFKIFDLIAKENEKK